MQCVQCVQRTHNLTINTLYHYTCFQLQATLYKNKLYVATSDYFGDASSGRVPSIYWGIFDVQSPKLCKPSLVDWGMVASEQVC